jgi:hypothetical protein
MKKLTFLILIFFTSELVAQEIRYLNRSPEALLMGDAFTSLADDTYTLFYNPAALANSRAVELSLLNPSFGVTNALDELDRFENFPSNDVSAINERLLGLPVYAQTGISPGIKMGGFFGINFLANSTTSLILRNQTHPEIDIDYRYDRGFVMGGAYTLGRAPSMRMEGGATGSYTTIGFGFKYINREGVDNTYDLFGTKLLSDISSGIADATAIKEAFGYSEGKAYGYDFGVLHSEVVGRSKFNLGLSVMDIGDTRFEIEEGTAPIPDQEMIVNLGSSWEQNFGLFNTTFAFDLHPLNSTIDFGRKIHLGVKIGLPLVDIMAGFNAGYLSYGAALNIWPVRLMAGFYEVEIGAEYKQEVGKRAVLYLSFFETAFDL